MFTAQNLSTSKSHTPENPRTQTGELGRMKTQLGATALEPDDEMNDAHTNAQTGGKTGGQRGSPAGQWDAAESECAG